MLRGVEDGKDKDDVIGGGRGCEREEELHWGSRTDKGEPREHSLCDFGRITICYCAIRVARGKQLPSTYRESELVLSTSPLYPTIIG
jgi:hypothetical protein